MAPLTTRARLALMSTHTTDSTWPVRMASGTTELPIPIKYHTYVVALAYVDVWGNQFSVQ